jgi:large subunit ribosomal protein L25
MAEQVTFAAQRRTAFGKAASKLRRQGIVPANIIGRGRDSVAIQLNAHDFERFLAKHSPTTVLQLTLDGGKAGENVVVQHVQHEPVSRAIQHVDFLHVDMRRLMRARVPIHLVGEAPGVKLYDGIVLTLLDHIDVEALPADLSEVVSLDIGNLVDLKSTLYVRDVVTPASIKVLTDPDEPVVKLEPPRIAAEEVPAAAPEAAAQTEGAPAAPSEGRAEAKSAES